MDIRKRIVEIIGEEQKRLLAASVPTDLSMVSSGVVTNVFPDGALISLSNGTTIKVRNPHSAPKGQGVLVVQSSSDSVAIPEFFQQPIDIPLETKMFEPTGERLCFSAIVQGVLRLCFKDYSSSDIFVLQEFTFPDFSQGFQPFLIDPGRLTADGIRVRFGPKTKYVSIFWNDWTTNRATEKEHVVVYDIGDILKKGSQVESGVYYISGVVQKVNQTFPVWVAPSFPVEYTYPPQRVPARRIINQQIVDVFVNARSDGSITVIPLQRLDVYDWFYNLSLFPGITPVDQDHYLDGGGNLITLNFDQSRMQYLPQGSFPGFIVSSSGNGGGYTKYNFNGQDVVSYKTPFSSKQLPLTAQQIQPYEYDSALNLYYVFVDGNRNVTDVACIAGFSSDLVNEQLAITNYTAAVLGPNTSKSGAGSVYYTVTPPYNFPVYAFSFNTSGSAPVFNYLYSKDSSSVMGFQAGVASIVDANGNIISDPTLLNNATNYFQFLYNRSQSRKVGGFFVDNQSSPLENGLLHLRVFDPVSSTVKYTPSSKEKAPTFATNPNSQITEMQIYTSGD